MPQDVSALIATAANTDGKTTYHTPLDTSDAHVVQGAAGTVAEQTDETHYDHRKAEEDEESCQDVTKGRISFSKNKLYGRDVELGVLKKIYQELAVAETKRVVFLSGLSGTGKSALVDELVRQEQQQSDPTPPFYGSGKFNQFGSMAPFSAINEVLAQWSADITKRSSGKALRQIRSNLIKAGVGPKDEGSFVLMKMFPCLTPILIDDGKLDKQKMMSEDNEAPPASTTTNISMDALKVLLQVFVTALGRKQDNPVVIMFIDDLQWADEASLELISSLLTSHSVQHFLFIGAYRSDEVHQQHRKFMDRVQEGLGNGSGEEEKDSDQEKIDDENINKCDAVTHMEIGSLTHKDVAQFIADTLEKEDSGDVHDLADIVFDKTMGNIFYVMQALEELARRNIIYFDIMTYDWNYNLNLKKELKLFVENDVLNMIKNKIASLEGVHQRALVLAAYTRNVIDVETLRCLFESDGISLSSDDVTTMLNTLVDEGLLQILEVGSSEDSSSLYMFSHDLINEAARARVLEGEEQYKLVILIAKVLSSLWETTFAVRGGNDWMLFVATNHFNTVPREFLLESSIQPEAMSKLNLSASDLASAKASLTQSNVYLRAAIKYLPVEKKLRWQTDYQLCLDLHNRLLQSEASFQNYDVAEELINEVLGNAVNEGDKCHALATLLKVTAEKGEKDYNRGAKKGCDILELPFSPSKNYIAKERVLLKLQQRNQSLAALLKMPLVKDPILRMKMKLYSTTQEFANLSQNSALVKLIELRALRDAYTHKMVGPDLAHMFANSAVGLVKEGKFETALAYANLATSIMNQSPDVESGWIRLKLKFGVLQLRHAFHEDVPDCEVLYKRLISSGSVSEGMGCALTCAQAYYCGGLPLNSVWGTKLLLYERAARDFGKDSFVLLFQLNRQFLLNLSGKSECNLTTFKGEAFDEEKALSRLEGNSRSMAVRDISTLRMQLAFIFGDEECEDKMIEILATYPLTDMMVARQHLRLSFLGLAILERGKKVKHTKEVTEIGKTILKRMSVLSKAGSPNALPVYLCLIAMQSMSVSAFDKAIEASATANMVHLEAVMNERCALHLQEKGENTEMQAYMTKAVQCYHTWGAYAKVTHLKQKYTFLNDYKLVVPVSMSTASSLET